MPSIWKELHDCSSPVVELVKGFWSVNLGHGLFVATKDGPLGPNVLPFLTAVPCDSPQNAFAYLISPWGNEPPHLKFPYPAYKEGVGARISMFVASN